MIVNGTNRRRRRTRRWTRRWLSGVRGERGESGESAVFWIRVYYWLLSGYWDWHLQSVNQYLENSLGIKNEVATYISIK